MNSLHYGLTPKMKPISPHRSAVVAALDIGSSKIACLIARLRPQGPQQVLTRRSHTVEVIGFGHTAARGNGRSKNVSVTKAAGIMQFQHNCLIMPVQCPLCKCRPAMVFPRCLIITE